MARTSSTAEFLENDFNPDTPVSRGGRIWWSKALYPINLTLALVALYAGTEYMAGRDPVPQDPQIPAISQPDHRSLPESSGAGLFAKMGKAFKNGTTMLTGGFNQGSLSDLAVHDSLRPYGRGWLLPNEVTPSQLGLDPQRKPKSMVVKATHKASQKTGENATHIVAIMAKETDFKPRGAGTSTAGGFMQQTDQTFLNSIGKFGAQVGYGHLAKQLYKDSDDNYHVRHPETQDSIIALKYDLEVATDLAAALIKDNRRILTKEFGRDITVGESYIAYFFGAGKAISAIRLAQQNPHGRFASHPLFTGEVAANRFLADHTFGSYAAAIEKEMTQLTVLHYINDIRPNDYGQGHKEFQAVLNADKQYGFLDQFQDKAFLRAIVESPHAPHSVETRPEPRPEEGTRIAWQ